MFPAQREAFEDQSRHRAWPWGRGSAKTTTIQYAHIDTALTYDNCATIYLSDTIGRAKAVVWDELVSWSADFGGEPNINELVIRFPNGSRIFVTGADSIKHFNRKRGIKRIALVTPDECQDWDSEVLEYAVTKVFMPRLGDLEAHYGYKGRIIMAGTGGRDEGFWHDVCAKPELGFSVTRRTQFDNPHIKDPQGELEAACKAAGVAVDDPGIRREFFAEFNSGGNLRIFNVGESTLVSRATIPTDEVRLVVCVDFGTIDAASVAGWLYSPRHEHPVMAESTKAYGLSASEQVKYARSEAARMRALYNPVERPWIVGDGGGLGKGYIMDIAAAEKAFEVDASDKTDKVPNIRIMAGDLRTGQAKVCDDLQDFLKALKRPEWHPDFRGERIKGHMPDEIDASYMGYRKVKELHRYVAPAPPDKRDEDQRLRDSITATLRRREELQKTPPWRRARG